MQHTRAQFSGTVRRLLAALFIDVAAVPLSADEPGSARASATPFINHCNPRDFQSSLATYRSVDRLAPGKFVLEF